MFFKPKEHLTVLRERSWFPTWPLCFSFLLHAVTVYFLMTWNFPHPYGFVLPVVTVQIVEEKKEKAPLPPPPILSKPKEIRKAAPPEPPSRPAETPKEEVPPPAVLQAAQQEVPRVFPLGEEKIGVEEKPKEEWMEKVEPGRWGTAEGAQETPPLRAVKEEPAMSLTAEPRSASQGIPGGLAGVNPWGKGTGVEIGSPGGVEGGKGTVPPKGARTGSVYFQGEGIGRGDLGSYLGNARMKIEKAKRYPREARRRGWEGRVVLSFQINPRGEVAQIRLIQSSGYPALDEEGIATLRRASPFSPPPWSEEEKVELEIPLVFRLEERR